MKKVWIILFILGLFAPGIVAQEAGNRGVYGPQTQRANPSNGVIYGAENKDLIPVQFIEAYVLVNAAPDEFIALFGAAQEAPTAIESNQKVNAQIEQFLSAAEKLGVPAFIGSQNQWSLAKADATKGDPTWAYIDDSFATWHRQYGFAAFPYTPQANGYFRRLDNGSIGQASDRVKGLFHHPQNVNRYKRVKALQSETGFSVAQIVLGYLLGQPFPVFPIVGPQKIADLEESLRAADITLTPDHLVFLTEET